MPHDRRQLILLGGGGHAAVAADIAHAAGWNLLGFFDDDPAAALPGNIPHLGPISQASSFISRQNAPISLHCAVGDPTLRRTWSDDFATLPHPPLIHPQSTISPKVTLGPGLFIGPNVVINVRSHLGRGSIINTGTIVEHDCTIADFAHIAPGSVLGGNVTIGRDTLIGLGSVIHPGLTIGRGVTVGAGSVVVRDIPDFRRAWGVPARIRPETGTENA